MARLGQVTVVVIVAMLALTAAEQGFGAQPLPLTARVIAHGELAGFGPFGPAHVQTFTTPASFLAAYQQAATPSQLSQWVASLKREGFVAVAAEELGSRRANRGGLSWAMELGSFNQRIVIALEKIEDSLSRAQERFVSGKVPVGVDVPDWLPDGDPRLQEADIVTLRAHTKEIEELARSAEEERP